MAAIARQWKPGAGRRILSRSGFTQIPVSGAVFYFIGAIFGPACTGANPFIYF
jgi:hypothetical protein